MKKAIFKKYTSFIDNINNLTTQDVRWRDGREIGKGIVHCCETKYYYPVISFNEKNQLTKFFQIIFETSAKKW